MFSHLPKENREFVKLVDEFSPFSWSGTIRVPAPCQYAHKLAFLVAQSIHQDPHEGLKDKLFFL